MGSARTTSTINLSLFHTEQAPLFPPFSPEKSLLAENTEQPNPINSTATPPIPVFWPDGELSDILTQELTVSRLNRIHKYLWLAGRVGNIRPLHRQKIMERDIIITEQTDLHLVWHESRIYIKPLPKFLLHYEFFEKHICSRHIPSGEESTLYASACGLLLSYTHLIRHESDLLMARDSGLFPSALDISWDHWCAFAAEIKSNVSLDQVNRRYLYGELRISRLNIIYRFIIGDSRGFHYRYTQYTFFFQRNFGWLLLAFAYMTVILAAMQTVITSSFGQKSVLIQRASYGFGVSSLVAVVAVTTLVFFIFIGAFLGNLVLALKHDRLEQRKILAGRGNSS